MTEARGGCQCGAVRYVVGGGFGRASLCHCRMCQKAYGNCFAPLVTAHELTWTSGAPRYFRSSNRVKRGFCGNCGTPLTYEPDGTGVELAFCTLDTPELVAPSIQVGLGQRLEWCQNLAALPPRPDNEVSSAKAFEGEIVSLQHPDEEAPRVAPLSTSGRPLHGTSSVDIRPLRSSDEIHWRRLWCNYLKFYDSQVSEEIYSTSFARLISDSPNEYQACMAWTETGPVGLVHFLFHRHMWRRENVCYLQDLFVAPEARGLGVGRSLIQSVYAAADQQNCPSVYWLTQDFNHTARQLYDRVGVSTSFIKYSRA